MGSAIDDTRFSVYAVPAEGVSPGEARGGGRRGAAPRARRRRWTPRRSSAPRPGSSPRRSTPPTASRRSPASTARRSRSARPSRRCAAGRPTSRRSRRTRLAAAAERWLTPAPLGHRLPDKARTPTPRSRWPPSSLGRVPAGAFRPPGHADGACRSTVDREQRGSHELAETLVETAAPRQSPTTALPVTTAAGIEAWHVESAVVPMIALAFTFEGGAAQDPAGKSGCAQMLARLLDEGAGDLTSDAFQERLAARAIELSFHAGPDAVGGSLKMLVKHADEAFELLRPGAGQAALRPGRDRARPRPDHRRPALPAERSGRDGLPPLLRGGVRRPPLRPPVLRHGRERRGDHPRRPRGDACPASSAAAG